MQLSHQHTLPATQAQAWDALNDIDILKACIPGCESLTDVGDNRFELVVVASVGPVKAKFKGKLTLSDLEPPQGYTIHFEGQGGAAGHGKGSATVGLEPITVAADADADAVEGCELRYTATATVGGKIAQIGQRLVDMAAQRMASEFFTNFDKQLRARYAPVAEAASASTTEEGGTKASLWSRLRG